MILSSALSSAFNRRDSISRSRSSISDSSRCFRSINSSISFDCLSTTDDCAFTSWSSFCLSSRSESHSAKVSMFFRFVSWIEIVNDRDTNHTTSNLAIESSRQTTSDFNRSTSPSKSLIVCSFTFISPSRWFRISIWRGHSIFDVLRNSKNVVVFDLLRDVLSRFHSLQIRRSLHLCIRQFLF